MLFHTTINEEYMDDTRNFRQTQLLIIADGVSGTHDHR